MSKTSLVGLVKEEKIMNKIHVIRNHKIMLDFDLAEMYGVETKRLNEQLKRNLNRFPKDFMFTLSEKETQHLRSQNATSSWGGNRRNPNAFTEQGVAMLSSILNSETAIEAVINKTIIQNILFIISPIYNTSQYTYLYLENSFSLPPARSYKLCHSYPMPPRTWL